MLPLQAVLEPDRVENKKVHVGNVVFASLIIMLLPAVDPRQKHDRR